MTRPVQELLGLLELERLEDNLFRGDSRDIGGKSVFGGQVLGQALVAAARTVEGRQAHSLHAYFLRPGDMQARIVYDVERIRDGTSFTTRRVVAIQHGRPIFSMAASFQVAEDGVEHQAEMPEAPAPETLESELELRRRVANRVPERLRNIFTRPQPIDIRPVQPVDVFEPDAHPPCRDLWLKATDSLPDDPVMHQAMLAYASDFNLLAASLLPHGLTYLQRELQAASLDHAMWFHRPFRMDEWLLYSTESPSASGARGFARGNLFRQDGTLIASVAQEGLIRLRSG